LSVHRKELCLAGTTGDAARFAQAVPCTRRITSVSLTAIAYRGDYAACQRRGIATTRQRTKIGFRHHAARQRGAMARQRARPDQHPTLTSNAVMDKLTFVRLVSAVVPR
jgi:hypothetical protein